MDPPPQPEQFPPARRTRHNFRSHGHMRFAVQRQFEHGLHPGPVPRLLSVSYYLGTSLIADLNGNLVAANSPHILRTIYINSGWDSIAAAFSADIRQISYHADVIAG